METFTKDGIEYVVVKSETVADMIAGGLNNLAAVCAQNKIARTIYARRPKGTKIYMMQQWESGAISAPVC